MYHPILENYAKELFTDPHRVAHVIEKSFRNQREIDHIIWDTMARKCREYGFSVETQDFSAVFVEGWDDQPDLKELMTQIITPTDFSEVRLEDYM